MNLKRLYLRAGLLTLAAVLGLAGLSTVLQGTPTALADDPPTGLGRTPWQYYNPAVVNGISLSPAPVHGDVRYYGLAPATPAADSLDWNACGTSPVCPDPDIIGRYQPSGSRLSTCLTTQADFTFYQSFVSIPLTTILTEFKVVMETADDGAQVALINSGNGGLPQVLNPGSYIFLGGAQQTTDLSSVVKLGEVNRVVITQVDDCATGNNLRVARIVLNGTVVPVDSTPPVISWDSEPVNEATGPDGAIHNFTATAIDNEDGSVPVTCTPASGSLFPLGTTTITCTATDAAGNSASVTFTKTVVDTTPPAANCIETTNPSGKNVPNSGLNAGQSGQNPDGFYQLQASDIVGVASIVVADSGSDFVSDTFVNGDKVKITQAPGAKPSDSRPGAGVIVSNLKLKGDAILRVTDTFGNITEVSCKVAPLPK